MKIPSSTSPYSRMFAALRKLIVEARTAEIYERREQITDKALRQLDGIEKILMTAMQERGRKGGTKTAERGPEYFRQIAAMRKTRAGGRPKKQAASDQTLPLPKSLQ